MLNEFAGIIVDEFPSNLPYVRNISHHIDLILGSSLLNKSTYRMNSEENEEVKSQE